MKISEIPKQRLSTLNKGLDETSNLTEWLAVDQKKLLQYLGKSEELSGLKTLVKRIPDISVPKKIEWVGSELPKELSEKLHDHRSDIVRSWVCYSMAKRAKTIKASLRAVKPFALSNHFGLREVAWMAVREKICLDPSGYIKELESWTKSKNPYQRRFATEATRPRGVWAKHIRELREDPKSGVLLLQNLYEDPSRYVQDSVANWLNDAAKDNPNWVKKLTEKWLGSSKTDETKYIVKRATRSIK